ncbi:Hydroxyacylglutathione hydrolase GloC [BD1-7 clade bacterium]|uniref:Hydroxyacylglutathione hydrolase GloC n=1 Tax=BD1-7 clade bacterium TaxID=2029982 RepID=A0A5S9QNL0_9GAMM|nr:Hydroxyacylglutathione hydrolase GloC [BD1-7 clade bacterium]CAA0120738.1 Hydroxyacylglutathione hydrolase GloC [BD1-7 clade bacterium]
MALKIMIAPVTAYQQNCSILICTETQKAALVDPGGEADRLKQTLTENNLTLEKIFITHGHLDHAGAAKQIAEDLNVPIEGPHKGDKYWLDDLEQYAQMMQFPPTRNFNPDRWLVDGDTIKFGNITLNVIHCPGHTPGHVVFYYPAAQVAFVGDVIFQGSIGRTDFPGGNHDDLITSIRSKLFPLGDDIQFVPGHGPTSTFGQERQTNPFVADSKYG